MRRRLGPVGLVLLLSGALLATAPASSSAQERAAGGAVEQFGACLRSGGTGDLLLLVDQSQSLQETDPEGARVRAASYLLGRLASSTAASGTRVDVAVAGFDVDYTKVVDWQTLTPTSATGLQQQLQVFASRNIGLDTDYVNALDGARKELLSRRTAGGARCQAVLWFTDGQFDIEERRTRAAVELGGLRKPYALEVRLDSEDGVRRAEELGRVALCRPGGLADQLRTTDTSVIAVGLGRQPDDFAFLRRITKGTEGCGRLSASGGELHVANDLDDLYSAFELLSDPERPPTATTTGVCAVKLCAQAHRFVLDLSVRAVHVLADSGKDGVQVVVDPPGAFPAKTFSYDATGARRATTLGGQRVVAQWLSPQLLDLSIDRTRAAGWTGRWAATFVAPQGSVEGLVARTQLRITGDLVPGLPTPEPPALTVGRRAAITPILRSEANGAVVPPARVTGQMVLTGVLRTVDGRQIPLGAGSLVPGRPAAADLTGVNPGPAVLRLRLKLATSGIPARPGSARVPGTQLADRVLQVPVTLVAPPTYPSVGQAVLRQSGETSLLQGAVTVTGPGCVWLDAPASQVLTAPAGVGAADFRSPASSQATCQSLAAGQQAEMPLEVAFAQAGNGTISGRAVVRSLPARDSAEAVVASSATFVADAVSPVDTGRRLAVLLVALLLGTGLPLAFLYLGKWWTARIPGLPLLVGVVRVRREGSAVLRDGVPLEVDARDVDYLQLPRGGARRIQLPGTDVVLQTTPGWRPTSPGEVRVRTSRTAVGGSVSRHARDGLRLPLTVHNSWIGLVDGAHEPDVDLVLLVPGTADAGVYARLSEDVRQHLPRALDTLPPPPPGGPPAPGSGTPDGDLPPAPYGGSDGDDWSPPSRTDAPPPPERHRRTARPSASGNEPETQELPGLSPPLPAQPLAPDAGQPAGGADWWDAPPPR